MTNTPNLSSLFNYPPEDAIGSGGNTWSADPITSISSLQSDRLGAFRQGSLGCEKRANACHLADYPFPQLLVENFITKLAGQIIGRISVLRLDQAQLIDVAAFLDVNRQTILKSADCFPDRAQSVGSRIQLHQPDAIPSAILQHLRKPPFVQTHSTGKVAACLQ
jgi:hypothetical protein